MRDPDRPLWQQFVLSFREHWFAAMSGGASVPFVIAAVYIDNKYGQTLLAIAALVCAGFAAFRVWKSERLRVLELEKRLTPKISISLVRVPNGVRVVGTRRTSSSPQPQLPGPDSKWVQIIVNPTTDVPLTECEVRLIRVEKIDDSGGAEIILTEPVFCTWSKMTGDEQKRITIPAGISQAVNIFSVEQGNPHLFTHTTNVEFDFDQKIQRPGRYRLTVGASAKECPTEIISLIFEWGGSYENIKIRTDSCHTENI